jgi:Fe-S cluster biogenesis protein NfuA
MTKIKNKSLLKKVEEALDSIRPYLQTDGGDILIDEITDDLVVKVKLLGACKSCNLNFQTLKVGVEQTIKKAVPEIKAVISVESDE